MGLYNRVLSTARLRRTERVFGPAGLDIDPGPPADSSLGAVREELEALALEPGLRKKKSSLSVLFSSPAHHSSLPNMTFRS